MTARTGDIFSPDYWASMAVPSCSFESRFAMAEVDAVSAGDIEPPLRDAMRGFLARCKRALQRSARKVRMARKRRRGYA